MAKVIPIGEPANESERLLIAHLRDTLPDAYLVLHNFELEQHGQWYEIDIAVLAPHAVYLADAKGTRGRIDVYQSKWHPEGRASFRSPLLNLRKHARVLHGVLVSQNPNDPQIGSVFVDAVVILTAPNARLFDPERRDCRRVVTQSGCAKFLRDKERVPGHFLEDTRGYHNLILQILSGNTRPKKGALCFRDWVVLERLSGTEEYTEYRAYHRLMGQSDTVLLRVYQADPYLPETERKTQQRLLSNAYAALNKLHHPAIVGVRDFFATEAEDQYVLITEDVAGDSLYTLIKQGQLTLEQKFRVLREIFAALDHAHSHDVIHRNINPADILLSKGGEPHLINFEYARTGGNSAGTIAGEIADVLDMAYQAPECYREPSAASAASDVFSFGLVLYELFSGQRAFSGMILVFRRDTRFAMSLEEIQAGLPAGFDGWLQSLCAFEPNKRPSAKAALKAFEVCTGETTSDDGKESRMPEAPDKPEVDYEQLPAQYPLTAKYVIEKKLGKGSFSIVYKAVDTWADVPRAIKLVVKDRYSPLGRLKQEYRASQALREHPHPHVAKLYEADVLPDGVPYLVFEYVDGLDVEALIGTQSLEENWVLGKQAADALCHLHRHEVFHCDIKPKNLLWTDKGAKLIDFNVSVRAADAALQAGGSKRYLPPDYDFVQEPRAEELADRDAYALGLTLYQLLTGEYPWPHVNQPPPGKAPHDPGKLPGGRTLSAGLIEFLRHALAPRRSERFQDMPAMLKAMQGIQQLIRVVQPDTTSTPLWLPVENEDIRPDSNPFVSYLLTLYSQSRHSNSGTRGLDKFGEQIYVKTRLDKDLAPAILGGEFGLVIITGNAGDGKTAFLQRLEHRAGSKGALLEPNPQGNGCRFELAGWRFVSNYDGSQDEGDTANDEVLSTFFAPFNGDKIKMPDKESRLIAINEGRLVDFLAHQGCRFTHLKALVREGLNGAKARHGLVVVNLNLRQVLAADGPSIFERLIRRLTALDFWHPCQDCDLCEHCYVRHNVRSFQDAKVGPALILRLQMLYILTNLRARLHITLRDLRSALAFMLAGTRNCDEIHALYERGDIEAIAKGFYFNAWSGSGESADRLLKLLHETDISQGTNVALDRRLALVVPSRQTERFAFEQRGKYYLDIMECLFNDLPREYAGVSNFGVSNSCAARFQQHRDYVAMMRRLHYFERRDEGWRQMLPYRYADKLLDLLNGKYSEEQAVKDFIQAVNHAEGLYSAERLEGQLALQVRRVENGTIRSYRVFSSEGFKLLREDAAGQMRFVEHAPTVLVLKYHNQRGQDAELVVNLDIFEMLGRLNQGYRPTVEEVQGYYLSLAVFKNVLASAPYQDVLLTVTGHEFYKISRRQGGALSLSQLGRNI